MTAREYTVIDAIESQMGASCLSLRQALEGIGLDPEMPVAVLRALLAEHPPRIVLDDAEFGDDPVAAIEAIKSQCDDSYIAGCLAGWLDRWEHWTGRLAEHNTPTPDPPADHSRCSHDEDYCEVLSAGAVPVQEPTCTTCGDRKRVPSALPSMLGRTEPCPVCAVPNPESPEA